MSKPPKARKANNAIGQQWRKVAHRKMRQTEQAKANQGDQRQQHDEALNLARELDAKQVDDRTEGNQPKGANQWRNSQQGVQIASKAERDIAANEEIRAPVVPAHEKAPMAPQHGFGKG